MPWVSYVKIEDAAPLVDAVNNARTQREHELARAYLHGYKDRAEQCGVRWPCIELDLRVMADDEEDERPICCGEFLDWKPVEEKEQ